MKMRASRGWYNYALVQKGLYFPFNPFPLLGAILYRPLLYPRPFLNNHLEWKFSHVTNVRLGSCEPSFQWYKIPQIFAIRTFNCSITKCHL